MNKSGIVILTLMTSAIWFGCDPMDVETKTEEESQVIKSLPYSEIPLEKVAGTFETDGRNWVIAGNVTSDFQTENDLQIQEGSGVLINNPSDEENANIFTGFEHGDIELDLELLIPKGSNSGLYFQSRYEIQLLDSWKKTEVTSGDCGGIYERWDDTLPDGEKGYEGTAPAQNASKAPGLWQKFHIKFRAPRFDDKGNKIENAVFEEVIHNGIKIHENVELTGPTRGAIDGDGETTSAPLMIQGDHGPVAFRNMKYKLYGNDTLTTSNVQYTYYEVETPITSMPPFDSLQPIETGSTEIMDVLDLSKRRDGVAFQFTGKLNVITPGDYLFHQYSDDGSQLFIDGEMLVDNDGKHDLEAKRGLIYLTAGSHDIQIDYFNNSWGKGMMLWYEGPQIELRLLQGKNPYSSNYNKDRLLIDVTQEPEMIRGFFNYGDEKRTHVIAVGNPENIHYAYDLSNASLLKVWRGGFADVTEMWQGRGIDQLLVPQTMAPEIMESALVADLSDESQPYPTALSESIRPAGYNIDDEGRPIFKFTAGSNEIQDALSPGANDGIERTVSINGEGTFYTRAGFGDYIQKVNDDFYVIDGRFYLQNIGKNEPIIRTIDGRQEILFRLSKASPVNYSILW